MPTASVDLPESAFPLVIEFFRVTDPDGVELIHKIEVAGPGVARIPALKGGGPPVWVRTTSADGQVQEAWPHGYGRTAAGGSVADR